MDLDQLHAVTCMNSVQGSLQDFVTWWCYPVKWARSLQVTPLQYDTVLSQLKGKRIKSMGYQNFYRQYNELDLRVFQRCQFASFVQLLANHLNQVLYLQSCGRGDLH